MATKSSIHIKPCKVTSSGPHNWRTPEYMRNIGESRIYVVSELSSDNEQWINPDFGNPDLQTHYDNIKRMVKEKTGRAMQEKERERKGKNGKIIKVAGCSPIREGVLLIRPETTLAGLSFISYFEIGKLPEISRTGQTRLYGIELRIECKQGSLSFG